MSNCKEGCECEGDEVWSGDECVDREECGCWYRGRYLQVGGMNGQCKTTLQAAITLTCKLNVKIIGCHAPYSECKKFRLF